MPRFTSLFFAASIWLHTFSSFGAGLPEPVVSQREADSRTWSRTTVIQARDGRSRTNVSSYKELATGMHYWRDGQWVDAQPVFEVFPDGIVARQCRHRVVLARNLNTAGAVDLQVGGDPINPEMQRYRGQILGLAYTDAASGRNVLIAHIKDCAAELIAPHQVLFRDAFQGDVKGDVLYTLTREGLSQWVLLRQNPPPPEDYQIDSQFARIEVWSEWLEAPEPVKRPRVLRSESDPVLRVTMADPDLRDEELAFGATMWMGPGAAFPLENDTPEQGFDPEVPIGKLWIHAVDPQGGLPRVFLIEQADYRSIAPRLQLLPQAAAVKPDNKNAQMAAATARALGRATLWAGSAHR